MGLLLFWLGCALTLGVAYGSARHSGLAVLEPGATAAALFVLAALLAAVGVSGSAFGRRRRLWTTLQVLAALSWCGARGWSAGEDLRLAAWTASGRGLPAGLIELEVKGASASGPRCQVLTSAPQNEVRLLLFLPEKACPLGSGQRIRVRAGDLRSSEAPPYPGAPDPVDRARAQGADRLGVAQRSWNRRAATPGYWTWVAQGRHRAWELARGDDALGFLFASVLGARDVLPSHRRDELRAAGLGHLVAVSGLHVALVSWALRLGSLRVASMITGSPMLGIVASWIPMLAYVGLTGAPASAVRAASMLILLGLGNLVGRPAHGLTVLAVAATGMLIYRPAWSIDPGFQLSVAAMAALTRNPPGAGLLLTTWRVTWAIAPLSALHFAQTSAYGLVANLVAVPVFGLVVLPLGLVAWLAQPWLGDWVLVPARAAAMVIVDLAALISAWPVVPLGMVAACAAAFVLGGPAMVRRGLGHLRPPWLACVGMVGVFVHLQWASGPAVRVHDWIAVGTARNPTIVARDRVDPTRACLVEAGSSGHAIVAVARSMQIERIGWPSDLDAAPPAEPPHVAWLVDTLDRSGLWSDETIGCVVPDVTRVRSLAAVCRRRAGEPLVAVAGPEPSCFVHGRWVPLGVENRIAFSNGLLD